MHSRRARFRRSRVGILVALAIVACDQSKPVSPVFLTSSCREVSFTATNGEGQYLLPVVNNQRVACRLPAVTSSCGCLSVRWSNSRDTVSPFSICYLELDYKAKTSGPSESTYSVRIQGAARPERLRVTVRDLDAPRALRRNSTVRAIRGSRWPLELGRTRDTLGISRIESVSTVGQRSRVGWTQYFDGRVCLTPVEGAWPAHVAGLAILSASGESVQWRALGLVPFSARRCEGDAVLVDVLERLPHCEDLVVETPTRRTRVSCRPGARIYLSVSQRIPLRVWMGEYSVRLPNRGP